MSRWEIDYSYKVLEGGALDIEAIDREEAEDLALADIKDMYPDVTDIKIEAVREIV